MDAKMAFTPELAPAAALAFLGTGAVLFLAGVALVGMLLLRRFEAARSVLLVGLTWACLYGLVLLGASFLSREKNLATGEKKYFCEVDCHLVYSVEKVTTAATLGDPTQPTRAQGFFCIVTLRAWFDPETISRTRGNFPLVPPHRRLRVVDEQGQSHGYSLAGQKALAGGFGSLGCLEQPLRPGEACTAELVFDVPARSPNPRVLLTTAEPITLLMIGHESSLFHKKIFFRLEPAEDAAAKLQ